MGREHSHRDGKCKQLEEEASKKRLEMKPWLWLISRDCQKNARKEPDNSMLTAISMESKRATQKERSQDTLTTLMLMELATATLTFLKKSTASLRTACLITACLEEISSLRIASKRTVTSTFQRQTQAGAMSTIIITCTVTLSATEEMTLIMQLAMSTTLSLTLLNSMMLS